MSKSESLTPLEMIGLYEEGIYTAAEVQFLLPKLLVEFPLEVSWSTLPSPWKEDVRRDALDWTPGTEVYDIRGGRHPRIEKGLTILRDWLLADPTR